ncbi:unnamed protein product [[Actinomadura] parvosata subsp. kistnae]|nr:unnamed protein product [Actinomadura parvosata subsp. kistnae]
MPPASLWRVAVRSHVCQSNVTDNKPQVEQTVQIHLKGQGLDMNSR